MGTADSDPARAAALRALPKIDELVRRPALAAATLPRWAITEGARAVVDARRAAILAAPSPTAADAAVSDDAVLDAARLLARPSLRPVINATGVVLHTNLGRAPLAAAAVDAIVQASRGYATLEYDPDARARGRRGVHVAAHLAALTGAEASLVVNNGAAAVLLALAALADDREVVVSRGELVEIGGSFRIPDVVAASGAHMIEVGTTNKTHLRDVERAVTDRTALLLKVHRSNFALIGFTDEVDLPALVALGRTRAVATMIDLGSGALIDPATLGPGLAHEPTVAEVVATGVDVVSCSGDKLLGGPQAGLLLGRADAIARCAAHPLYRVLRADKVALAALEATLALYRDGGAPAEIPTLRMLALDAATIGRRVDDVITRVRAANPRLTLERVATTSAVGGGSLPTSTPASAAIAVTGDAQALDAALRAGDPPIVGRIADRRLLLDLRTVADDELTALADRLIALTT